MAGQLFFRFDVGNDIAFFDEIFPFFLLAGVQRRGEVVLIFVHIDSFLEMEIGVQTAKLPLSHVNPGQTIFCATVELRE